MKNTIIVSDTHFPYEHPDTFKFLTAIRDEYDIEINKHSGDVADNHTASYHEIEYGTLSAEEEFRLSKSKIQKLAEIFPSLTVTLGNHCILTARKARSAGIPSSHLSSYNEVYGVDWDWVDKDYFKINKYQHCLLSHSQSCSTLNNAKVHSHCSIQGHHHGSFGIEYFADTEVLRWAMTVSCLIDPNSPAFNYAKTSTVKRPILGCGGIIEDLPRLWPMQLKKSGRWDNTLGRMK